MHATSRVLEPMVTEVCGMQKLGNMTISQMMFRIHYMIMDDYDSFSILALESYLKHPVNVEVYRQDPMSFLSKVPDGVADKIRAASESRWMTLADTGGLLIKRCDKPTPYEFKVMCAADYDGVDGPVFKAICKQLKCHSHGIEGPSLIKMIFLYLANHAPGDRAGKGHSNFLAIISCLDTPEFRIGVTFTAALLPFHKACAKFYNGTCCKIVPESATISNRFCEWSVFNAFVVDWATRMNDNWHLVLPDVWTYILGEVDVYDLSHTDFVEEWDKRIKDRVRAVLYITVVL
jgi:hypothetical protein